MEFDSGKVRKHPPFAGMHYSAVEPNIRPVAALRLQISGRFFARRGLPLEGRDRVASALSFSIATGKWSLVHEQPKHSKRVRCSDELAEVHRFANVRVRAQRVAAYYVFFFCRCRENDDRIQLGAIVCPEPFQHIQPVDARQLEIQKSQCGLSGCISPRMYPGPEEIVERFRTVPY